MNPLSVATDTVGIDEGSLGDGYGRKPQDEKLECSAELHRDQFCRTLREKADGGSRREKRDAIRAVTLSTKKTAVSVGGSLRHGWCVVLSLEDRRPFAFGKGGQAARQAVPARRNERLAV